MQKMHVIGLLLLIMSGTQARAQQQAQEQAAAKHDAPAVEKRLPATEAKEVDELEKVMQSAYDDSDQQAELGASDM